jgi:hypothetical protein
VSLTRNNHNKLIQPYPQPLASVFNTKKVVMLNISVSVQVTVCSGISQTQSMDRHPSALQSDEVGKKLIKFHHNYKKIPQLLGILSAFLVAANNGVEVWQNLRNNVNISSLSDQLSSVEQVQLDSRETD